MKIIAYAFLAVLIIVLFAVIEILAHGLIRMACLIGLTFLTVSMFHRINKWQGD